MGNIDQGERGQLLIVAAVGFTIVLIALALALNTAVYGDVHVSQTDSSSFEESTATQYQNSAQRGITALLPVTAENETRDELLDRFEEEVKLWKNLTRDQYLRDGVATSVELVDVTQQNRRIIQDDSDRSFENRTGNPDWTVVSNLSADSSFQMTIRNELLATDENDSFTFEAVEDGSSFWTLSAYSTNKSEIVVDINDTRQYSTNESTLQIDITEGVFNDTGEEVSFHSFVDEDSVEPPYDELRYTNADNVTGTYELVGDNLVVDEKHYNEIGSPRIDSQIVAASATISYQSPELTYRTEVHVGGSSDE